MMMSETEHQACKSLLLDNFNRKNNSTNAGCESLVLDFTARKRQKIDRETEKYRNCDYIFGSTALIERLWSFAKFLLRENRSRMSPLKFEPILILKIDRKYWNQELASAALKRAHENLKQRKNALIIDRAGSQYRDLQREE